MGCESSKPIKSAAVAAGETRSVKGVGQTERLLSRKERLQLKNSSSISPPPSLGVGGGGDGSSSKTKGSSTNHAPVPSGPKLDGAGNLTREEVVRRTTCSIVTKDVVLGTPEQPLNVEYAHWTQRGYYPDTPHKENQDALSIDAPSFAAEPGGAMLAVYDGHGHAGDQCAHFCERTLPQCVAKYVRQARVKAYKEYLQRHNRTGPAYCPDQWPLLTPDEYEGCCRRAFLECNALLHKSKEIDDKLSGTTAVSVNFHGDFVTVCNVGDSRVILGHAKNDDFGGDQVEETKEEEKEEISAYDDCRAASTNGRRPHHCGTDVLSIPLSRDQTPYRKDERERVQKLGAKIMSVDQMEGHVKMHDNWGDIVLGDIVDIHGDPPRIWEDGKDYPGTTFTRSIGDKVAEDIGVNAEPELLSTRLTRNDKYLVIATDGVFEFLSNKHIIEVCARSDNPLTACQSLVEAAYDQWLIHENRTDDITLIVCFLQCDRPREKGTTLDLLHLASTKADDRLSTFPHPSPGWSQANETAATTSMTVDDPDEAESLQEWDAIDEGEVAA